MVKLEKPVKLHDLVQRQTAQSTYSHTSLSWDALCQLIEKQGVGTTSYREGIIEVSLPVEDEDGNPLFFTPVITLGQGDELVGTYESRKEGEEPRKSVGIATTDPEFMKMRSPAKYCKAILYRSDVLAETDDNCHSDCWELISLNAAIDAVEVIHPDTLMHNHFGSDGGTDTNMTDAEFVAMLRQSFNYWKNKAMLVEVKA